jgi:hypothetical protein
MKRLISILIGLAAVVVPTTAMAQSPAPTSGAPASTSCDAQHVLLLIDQSKSLGTTDPNKQRADAAKTFVGSLASSGLPTTLAIAGFGNGVTDIESYDLPKQEENALAVAGDIASVHTDDNTDYVYALKTASEHFAKVDAPSQCKTLLWFTDGAYDITQVNAATQAYTYETNVDVINHQLGGQICGPLPATTRLDSPVSEQIKHAGFTVKLIDLDINANGPPDPHRAETSPVIDHLLPPQPDGTDPCSVPGEHIAVSSASDLASKFFDEASKFFNEAQQAAGRAKVDCSVLASGIPAGLVKSVAVLAEPATAPVTITSPSGPVSTGVRSFSDDERKQAGNVTASADGGALDRCFLDVDAAAHLDPAVKLYSKATKSLVSFVVGGPGADQNRALSVGPDFINVAAEMDGTPVTPPPSWDALNRQWQIEQGQTSHALDFKVTPSVLAVPSKALEPLSAQIEVTNSPPRPDVAWSGATRLEGKGTIDGALVVTPKATTGGQLCVSVPEHVLLSNPRGAPLGQLEAAQTNTCHTDDEPFSIPARFVVDHELNASGTGAVSYSTTYTPPGEHAAQDLDNDTASLPTFTVSKTANGRTWFAATTGLVVLSAVLSLLALWLTARRQGRPPNPDDYVAARLPLPRDSSTGSLVMPDASVTMKDFRPISGSRSRYNLTNGVSIRRWTSLNPFADIAAEAVADRGVVIAQPSLGTHLAGGRRTRIPVRFASMLLTRVTEDTNTSADAVLLVRRGTTPSVAEEMLAKHLADANRDLARAGTRNSSSRVASARAPLTGAGSVPQPPEPPDRRVPPAPTDHFVEASSGPAPASPATNSTRRLLRPPPPPSRSRR